jgi:hypothetical protein
MDAFGRAARGEVRIYLVGGATAVLLGWRQATIDVDLVMRPEEDALLRAVPALKEELQINVELASPADFIPVPPGWEDRGTFITRVGRATFLHFDLYAQALAKVERGHRQDLLDVSEMLSRGLIERPRALEYFERIEPYLYRYPALDPGTFRRAVDAAFGPAAPGA